MSPRLAVSNLESDVDGGLRFLLIQWALFHPQKCHDVFSTGKRLPLLSRIFTYAIVFRLTKVPFFRLHDILVKNCQV